MHSSYFLNGLACFDLFIPNLVVRANLFKNVLLIDVYFLSKKPSSLVFTSIVQLSEKLNKKRTIFNSITCGNYTDNQCEQQRFQTFGLPNMFVTDISCFLSGLVRTSIFLDGVPDKTIRPKTHIYMNSAISHCW